MCWEYLRGVVRMIINTQNGGARRYCTQPSTGEVDALTVSHDNGIFNLEVQLLTVAAAYSGYPLRFECRHVQAPGTLRPPGFIVSVNDARILCTHKRQHLQLVSPSTYEILRIQDVEYIHMQISLEFLICTISWCCNRSNGR